MVWQAHRSEVEGSPRPRNPQDDDTGGRRRRQWLPRSRWARVAVLIAALVVLIVAGGGAGGWLYVRSLDKRIEKVDAFKGLNEEQRPVRAAESALNFLVVGKDQPEPGDTISRTDTIMLVHVPQSRDRAQVISIPRDTWTRIPESPPEVGGGPRTAKINAAYAWGGTPLLVRTMEQFTGVRIDHVVLVDFAGFGTVIDALGGVDVTVDRPYTSDASGGQVYQPGVHHMNSAVALEYARERHQFADGDYSRMRHQQAVVAAVMQEVSRKGIVANPAQLNDFLRATAGAVQVDRNLSLFDTIWSLRGLGVQDVTMLTSPTTGTGMVGDQSVIFPDVKASAKLFAAVRSDTMDRWLAENPTARNSN